MPGEPAEELDRILAVGVGEQLLHAFDHRGVIEIDAELVRRATPEQGVRAFLLLHLAHRLAGLVEEGAHAALAEALDQRTGRQPADAHVDGSLKGLHERPEADQQGADRLAVARSAGPDQGGAEDLFACMDAQSASVDGRLGK